MNDDKSLTAEQLDFKYNPDGDGEHPIFTRADWRNAVLELATSDGYWDWLVYQISLQK